METKQTKTLGQAQSIEIDMSEPSMKFGEMGINKLMMLVGTNGVGKSLVMKLIWILSTHLTHLLTAIKHKIPFNEKVGIQYLFDKSFDDCDFTGKMTLLFQFGNFITVELEAGKITNLVCSLEEDTEPDGQPIYMSKDTRLFSNIIQYMKYKTALGITPGVPKSDIDFNKLTDAYKIFDIIFMEELLLSIETKTTPKLIENFNKSIQKFDPEFSITNIKLDYTKSDILISTTKKTDFSIVTLGAGHQSLGTMLLFLEYRAQ